MKKFIYSLIILFTSIFSFGQSVLIEPSTATKPFVIKSTGITYGQFSTTNSDGADLRFRRLATGDGSAGIIVGNISTFTDRFSIYSSASYPLALGSNNNEYMRIDNDGKVGIGTSSPNFNLQLHKSGVGNSSVIQLTNETIGSASTDGLYIGENNFGNASIYNLENGYLGLGTNSSTFLQLAPNSKACLSCLAPAGKFDIWHNTANTVNNPHITLKTTTDLSEIKVKSENLNASRYFLQNFYLGSATPSLNYYNLYYGLDNLLTVTGDGRFGINSTSPADLLHLKPISNTGDVYARLSSTTGLTGLRLQNNGGDWSMYTNEFNKLFFGYSTNNFTSTSEVITMEPSGSEYVLYSSTNNQVYLGSSANRWREIWSTNALNTSSDRRLKKDITEIKYGLEDIMKLKAVSYHWKNNSDSKLHLGFIAQEVEKIVPEVVTKSGLTDAEFEKLEKKGETVSDTYGMEYTSLIPVLVKAIQEQQKIIDSKSIELNKLQEKMQKMGELEARLATIESSLNIKQAAINVKTDK